MLSHLSISLSVGTFLCLLKLLLLFFPKCLHNAMHIIRNIYAELKLKLDSALSAMSDLYFNTDGEDITWFWYGEDFKNIIWFPAENITCLSSWFLLIPLSKCCMDWIFTYHLVSYGLNSSPGSWSPCWYAAKFSPEVHKVIEVCNTYLL